MTVQYDSTVFVVEDDATTREALMAQMRLRGVAAEGFSSAEDFLQSYDPARRGCIVLDYRLGGMSGLELLAVLKERRSTLPIIFMTGFADVAFAVKAMQAGAFTLLEKPANNDELWETVSKALEADRCRHAQRTEHTETQARLETLTADELEVFRRLLAGHANKRIASDLDIGLRTVELRRSNIMKKMQATSLPDLVRMAILIEFLKPTAHLS